jgi:Tfp pilus assembly protein PilV
VVSVLISLWLKLKHTVSSLNLGEPDRQPLLFVAQTTGLRAGADDPSTWHTGCRIESAVPGTFYGTFSKEDLVRKEILIGIMIAAMAILATACSQANESNTNTAANTNTGNTASTTITTTGPDNSEITTTTDSNGTKTETRTFKSNPRVSKVVVTTHGGNRTVAVYSASGEQKDVSKNEPPDVLHATGDAIADAAGWVKDKSVTAYDKTKEGAEKVADKTVDTTKTVSKKVADKTVDTTKTVANKTKEGAKKTGKAIKKVVAPTP